VTADVVVPRATGDVEVESATKVMTVWKHLLVEADSMGDNTGPVDTDMTGPVGSDPNVKWTYYDALIGDIPDPDLSMLSSVFQQAYIEVLPVGAGARANAPFGPHVPFDIHTPLSAGDKLEITNQGIRDIGTDASTWGVYLQACYEGGIHEDGDPTAEGFDVGHSDNSMVSVQYIEAMRDAALTNRAGIGGCRYHNYDELHFRREDSVHEIVHLFKVADVTTCDGSNGILEKGGDFPYLIGAQLRQIRSVPYPGAP
jgi:hypothetical protein